jgi:hypothetical protein
MGKISVIGHVPHIGLRLVSAVLIIAALAVPFPAHASSEKVIYNFQGGQDGANPYAGLIVGNDGAFYGTTGVGGGGPCADQAVPGCGTVFTLIPPASSGGAWTQKVLYRFQGGTDGEEPFRITKDNSGLALYGAVDGGSANCPLGCGIVFKLTPAADPNASWVKTVLYAFQGGSDLGAPNGLAVNAAGVLFGATGGRELPNSGNCETFPEGCGTIYMLSPPPNGTGNWIKTVLYNFTGEPDGFYPDNLVIGKHGALFGTTAYGGAGHCLSFFTADVGCGTVFELTPPTKLDGSWTKTILYSFQGGNDGVPSPLSVSPTGAFYGTVFKLAPPQTAHGSWTETVLHQFIGGADGGAPFIGFVNQSTGAVFGTTEWGGAYRPPNVPGGTAFKLTPSAKPSDPWNEITLHDFGAAGDGSFPSGILVRGMFGGLYGTTSFGGNSSCPDAGDGPGCGTIFEIFP